MSSLIHLYRSFVSDLGWTIAEDGEIRQGDVGVRIGAAGESRVLYMPDGVTHSPPDGGVWFHPAAEVSISTALRSRLHARMSMRMNSLIFALGLAIANFCIKKTGAARAADMSGEQIALAREVGVETDAKFFKFYGQLVGKLNAAMVGGDKGAQKVYPFTLIFRRNQQIGSKVIPAGIVTSPLFMEQLETAETSFMSVACRKNDIVALRGIMRAIMPGVTLSVADNPYVYCSPTAYGTEFFNTLGAYQKVRQHLRDIALILPDNEDLPGEIRTALLEICDIDLSGVFSDRSYQNIIPAAAAVKKDAPGEAGLILNARPTPAPAPQSSGGGLVLNFGNPTPQGGGEPKKGQRVLTSPDGTVYVIDTDNNIISSFKASGANGVPTHPAVQQPLTMVGDVEQSHLFNGLHAALFNDGKYRVMRWVGSSKTWEIDPGYAPRQKPIPTMGGASHGGLVLGGMMLPGNAGIAGQVVQSNNAVNGIVTGGYVPGRSPNVTPQY